MSTLQPNRHDRGWPKATPKAKPGMDGELGPSATFPTPLAAQNELKARGYRYAPEINSWPWQYGLCEARITGHYPAFRIVERA